MAPKNPLARLQAAKSGKPKPFGYIPDPDKKTQAIAQKLAAKHLGENFKSLELKNSDSEDFKEANIESIHDMLHEAGGNNLSDKQVRDIASKHLGIDYERKARIGGSAQEFHELGKAGIASAVAEARKTVGDVGTGKGARGTPGDWTKSGGGPTTISGDDVLSAYKNSPGLSPEEFHEDFKEQFGDRFDDEAVDSGAMDDAIAAAHDVYTGKTDTMPHESGAGGGDDEAAIRAHEDKVIRDAENEPDSDPDEVAELKQMAAERRGEKKYKPANEKLPGQHVAPRVASGPHAGKTWQERAQAKFGKPTAPLARLAQAKKKGPGSVQTGAKGGKYIELPGGGRRYVK